MLIVICGYAIKESIDEDVTKKQVNTIGLFGSEINKGYKYREKCDLIMPRLVAHPPLHRCRRAFSNISDWRPVLGDNGASWSIMMLGINTP